MKITGCENMKKIQNDKEILMVPIDKKRRKKFLQEEIRKIEREEFFEVVENFFDTYSIQMIKNNIEKPSFFSIDIHHENEYETACAFYNVKKEKIKTPDIFKEMKWGENVDLETCFKEWIMENYSIENLYYLFADRIKPLKK
jgi:hypothetical protein